MIVDDERAIGDLVASVLTPESMDTTVFTSGFDALAAMSTITFDLAIIDIMMPGIDGFELCTKIRAISSIPIIFLSAKDEEADKVIGFTLGGDDYITKPFHMRALILKVRNIIASREKLKDLYGQRLSLENLGVEISGGDDKFLQQLNEAIDRDIADPALNLDTLCRRIGLSRASLYRKLMSATGLSPARYIQSVRLNLAARMLRETQMSISEIATASGFNSLIHFSASFRKQYGVPPSRYAAGQDATGPEAAPGRENEPQE